MEESKLKSYLEVATNVAVLLVALAILGNFAWTQLAKKPDRTIQPGLRKGDKFSQLPGIDYTRSSQTLIIALSSKCEYCNDSIPFYRKLTELNLASNNTSRIVAVFPETSEEAGRYVQEQQISFDVVTMVNHKALNLPGTPSAVLVDNQGKILNFWIGRPSKDAEMEIIEAMERASAKSNTP